MRTKWLLDACYQIKQKKVVFVCRSIPNEFAVHTFCPFVTAARFIRLGGFRMRCNSQFAQRAAEEEAHAASTLHLWKRLVRAGSGRVSMMH